MRVKGIQKAERVIDIGHEIAEMIAVILGLKHRTHLVVRAPVYFGHRLYRITESSVKLLLGDAAECLVLAVHTDILRLVETAEHAHLRELGHTRQEHELKMLVGTLEHRIETLEDIPVLLFQVLIHVKHIQYRLVIFVDKNYGATAALFMSRSKHLDKAVPDVRTDFT